jgi:hypothetical protein
MGRAYLVCGGSAMPEQLSRDAGDAGDEIEPEEEEENIE